MIRALPPRACGSHVTREDGSSFERHSLYLGNAVGSPIELQIWVGPNFKVEICAIRLDTRDEVPLCEGPV